MNRLPFVPSTKKEALSLLLLRDLAERDNAALHKYLWSNHLAYASYYQARRRFGPNGVEPSRRLFFADMRLHLERAGSAGSQRSVLELGCSLGYNLRYVETGLFSVAEAVHGLDLDSLALQEGRRRLRSAGSRIELFEGDVECLDEFLGSRCYDVIFCCGLLLYFKEAEACAVIASMVRHARTLVGIAAVPHPLIDNRSLAGSAIREWDSTHIHNVDQMVAAAGHAIVGRRYQTRPDPAYFVFASPA